MIAALFAKLGLAAGGRLVGIALIAGLFAIGGLGFRLGVAKLDGMIEAARTAAIAGRDAHWRAEIERSNAEVERRRAENERVAAAASAATEQTIAGLNAALTELERRNASLPNADACGLGAGRTRELNRLRGH